jgi:hypothetical protein
MRSRAAHDAGNAEMNACKHRPYLDPHRFVLNLTETQSLLAMYAALIPGGSDRVHIGIEFFAGTGSPRPS